VDDQKLSELFKDAVADVPPPSFDHHDVVYESNRQRTRRRNGIIAGSALGVALLASGTVLGVALWKGSEPGGTSAASAPEVASDRNGSLGRSEVPNEDSAGPRAAPEGGAAQGQSDPPGEPKQGGDPGGDAAPTGSGGTPSGCGQADQELAAALAGELLAAASFETSPVDIGCPAGARGAAITVTENGRGGVISVVLTPPGTKVAHPTAGAMEESRTATAYTAEGEQLLLVSEPEQGSTEAPFQLELQRVADDLAARY
jgi:hypothetical protein